MFNPLNINAMKQNAAKSGESAPASNESTTSKLEVVKAAEPTQPTPLTVEQRITNLERMSTVRDKRERVKDASDRLNFFRLEYGGESLTIQLTTPEGKKFQTSHPKVANSVMDLMQEVIAEELRDVEKQILSMVV
jgi:hypothetical protein